MTTFDSTINNASSYWVVDIYQNIINKAASKRALIWQARLSTIVVVMLLGLFLVLLCNPSTKSGRL
eukprot:m.335963 g.335963  ORF g.335963 m.335963 type:complete len:66 (-) comp55688_c0_seq7:8-205(-)